MLILHSRWRQSNDKGSRKIFNWKNPSEVVSDASRKKCLHWKTLRFKGKSNIVLEDGVTVRPYVQIWSGGRAVRIGMDSEIGERCRISIANSLEIGEKVLFSSNVYITDCDYEYRNVDVPVID